jgi:hypothetical protein
MTTWSLFTLTARGTCWARAVDNFFPGRLKKWVHENVSFRSLYDGLYSVVENSVLFARQQRESNEYFKPIWMIDRQVKVRYYLAILANRLLFLKHRMYRIKPICLMGFVTWSFKSHVVFLRVYLTDLNSYHWGIMRQLSLNQVIYICPV